MSGGVQQHQEIYFCNKINVLVHLIIKRGAESMASFHTVSCERRDQIAVGTLNQPKTMNALGAETIGELLAA